MTRGSCLCGKTVYEAKIPLDSATGKPPALFLCHCRMCQKITGGTTTVSFEIPLANFHLVSGDLKKLYKKHEDEPEIEFFLYFCADCGSQIRVELAGDTRQMTALAVGTLDDPEFLETQPFLEVNVKRRPGWLASVPEAMQKQAY